MTQASATETVANPSPASPGTARGLLAEASDERIILSVPGTSYQIHLGVYQRPSTQVGKPIVGTIRAQARRIDVVRTGGRYIEPVYGRPRRVQGAVIAVDQGQQTVTVDAGVPMVCKVDAGQRAEQFKVGDFVSFDVLPGAAFTPASGSR